MENVERLTVTVPEMAKMLGVSTCTAYNLIHRVDFPVVRVGRRAVIPMDALNAGLKPNLVRRMISLPENQSEVHDMSSKYDSINTAAELVSEVQLHGLSTAQEDICRAQDIFGHTSIEELARLANDIGRNNRNGEPDPKGTCSSNRPETQSTFYSILTNIWHWEEVTWFWNQYTNPQTKELEKLRSDANRLNKENEKLTTQIKETVNDMLGSAEEVGKLTKRIESIQLRAEEAETEVIRLKSKLYDLLVERKETV